mmetsp:Transcript_11481/g.33095  ORF Transcript_11481/g.33095 Transcript_11481/m.33095 type:complete len:231 (-) Transcript_11481:318-1010(-)
MLRQEEGQGGDLGHVGHQALVLSTAKATSVPKNISAKKRRRDVLHRLTLQTAGHEVHPDVGPVRLHATLLGHNRDALAQGLGPVVVLADTEAGAAERRARRLPHLAHGWRPRGLRYDEQRALAAVDERRVGVACLQEGDEAPADVALPRQTSGGSGLVQVSPQAVPVANGVGASHALRGNVAQLAPCVCNIVPTADLVVVILVALRPWHWHLAAEVLKWARPAEQLAVHP